MRSIEILTKQSPVAKRIHRHEEIASRRPSAARNDIASQLPKS